MTKEFWKKRGVSPLIATVLLISFAVALATVVLNWGKNFEIIGEEDKCSGVSLTVRPTNYEVCSGGSGKDSYINFIIDNTGSSDISGLRIFIVGDKGTEFHDFNTLKINKGELLDIKDQSISYDFETYGNIRKVQFTPKITVNDEIESCPKNEITADKIGVC